MMYYLNFDIIRRILEDSNFRLGLALALGVGERAVSNTAKKYNEQPFGNSTFTKMAAVNFFESEGYTSENILTTEQPAK